MSEHLPSFEELNDTEIPPALEQYRGEITRIMEEAQPTVVGELKDLRPELKDHYSNRIEIAEISLSDTQYPASNLLRHFVIKEEGRPVMETVFKPLYGENEYRKTVEFVDKLDPAFYIREVAASIVDQEARLFVGLPTIVKEIDGKVGSLRMYIPSNIAETPTHLAKNHVVTDLDVFYRGRDFKKMAILDELSDNCDRSADNFLIYINDPNKGISIDMGNAFFRRSQKDNQVAIRYFLEHRDETHLDDELVAGLEAFINTEDRLLAPLDVNGEGKVVLDTHEKRIARLLLAHDVFDKARHMIKHNTILVHDY